MKTFKIALLATALVANSAAFAEVHPEGQTPAQIATYAVPEGNGYVDIASYTAPEQNNNATIGG